MKIRDELIMVVRAVRELLEGYRQTLSGVIKARENCNNEEDDKIYAGMISDIRFVIEWLRTARQPGRRRGVENLSSYQRLKIMDSVVFQNYYGSIEYEPWKVISWDSKNQPDEDQVFKIEQAIHKLSDREKEVFELHAYGFAEEKIAEYLDITRSSVQTYLERAREKIEYEKNNNIFLIF